ncbi:MAG: hypothetical protein QGG96_07075 [Candidatus Poseidoniaceae archaeon]|nr:hypothetical protein [Candidatus Poseidoniaceae archaeon]
MQPHPDPSQYYPPQVDPYAQTQFVHQNPQPQYVQPQMQTVVMPTAGAQMVMTPQGMVMVGKPQGDGLITAAYILAICSLIISPLFCGLPAFICAVIAMSQGHPKGGGALAASLICPVIGFIIAMLLLGAL